MAENTIFGNMSSFVPRMWLSLLKSSLIIALESGIESHRVPKTKATSSGKLLTNLSQPFEVPTLRRIQNCNLLIQKSTMFLEGQKVCPWELTSHSFVGVNAHKAYLNMWISKEFFHYKFVIYLFSNSFPLLYRVRLFVTFNLKTKKKN